MKKIPHVLIDSNVILRLLLNDVPPQYKLARTLFSSIENRDTIGLVSILVVNEIIWIMEHYYEKSRSEYLQQVMMLLGLPGIKILEIEKTRCIEILTSLEKTNRDFTDEYLLDKAVQKHFSIASFDKDFNKTPEVKKFS